MKTIMKISFIILCLCAKFSMAQTIGVRIPDTTGVNGSIIDIPVYVDSSVTGKGIISYQLKMNVYMVPLNLIGVITTGTMSAGLSTPTYNVNTSTNIITVSSAGTTVLSGTGVLLYLRFQLNQATSIGLYFSGVSGCFFNQGTPAMTLRSGTLNITNPPTITAYYANANPLTLGDSVQIYVSGGTSPYTYAVTNPAVATITSSGMLKAVGIGTTRVRVQSANSIIDTTDTDMEVRALKLSLPDTTILPLASVVYPVRINSTTSSSVLSGSFRINFSQGYVVPDSILLGGTLLQNASVTYQVFNGYTLVSFASSTALTGAGDLLKIRFKILNASNSYVYLQNVLFNQNLQANTKDGSIFYTAIPALAINPSYGEFFVGQTQQYTASGGKSPYVFSVTDTSKASMTVGGLFTAKKGGVVKAQVKDSLNTVTQTSSLQVYDGALTLPVTSALSGTYINYPIILSNYTGARPLYSLQLTISFQANMLDSVQAVVTNSIASGWSVTQNVQSDKIIIALAGATPITVNGIFFRINAKVKSSVAPGNAISFTASNAQCNDGDFYLKVNNGYVSVVSALQKDIGINTIPNITSSCTKTTQEIISGSVYNYNNVTYFIGDTLFVGYKLNSNAIVKDTVVLTSNLSVNTAVTFNFKTKANLSVTGSYVLKVFTQLSGDINVSNDTNTITFQVYGNPVVNLGNDTSMCNGSTKLLDATTSSASYLWSNAATSPTITVSASGQYWVKVTSSSGCIAYDTVVVTVNAAPTVSKLTGVGYTGICGLDSITLSTTAVVGNKYRWMLNGINTINSADTLSQLQVKNSGTYTVRVTNVFGCSSLMTDTVVAISTTRQASPLVTGATSICDGDTLKLFASALSGVTYRWTGPAGFLATTQNVQIANASATNAGAYSVYVIKNGATGKCDTSLSVAVTVTLNSKPTIKGIQSSGALSFCNGDSVTLKTDSVVGNSYRWFVNGSVTSNASDTLFKLLAKTSGTYNVRVTNASGCYAMMRDTIVTVKTKQSSPTITGLNAICEGDTLKLNASTSTGVIYNWTGPNSFNTSGQNISRPNATLSMAGIYSLYAVKVGATTSCDTSNSVQTTIAINVKPIVSTLTGNGYSGTCGLDSITLSTSAVAGVTYRWMVNGSNTGNAGDTLTQLLVKNSGTYTVKVTNALGCSSLTNDTVIAIATGRQTAPTVTGVLLLCEGDTLKLNASILSNATYRWTGPSGFVATSQNIQIPNITSIKSGSYNVYAIKNGATGKCDTSVIVSTIITINTKPVSTALTVLGNPNFCQGDSVILSVSQTSGSIYRWIRNGVILADSNYKYAAKTTGSYTVKVTNSGGCSETMIPLQITTNPKPTTGIIIGSSTVAVGSTQPYQVANTTGSSYQWMVNKGSQISGTTTNSIQVLWDATVGIGFVKVIETTITGCIGDTVAKTINIVTSVPDSLALSKDSVTCSNTLTIVKVKVSSNIAWTVANPNAWITVSPMSGFGNDSLVLNILANTDSLSRTGIITVNGGSLTKTIVVNQSGNVGINEVDVFAGIAIYPNPSSGVFTIENNAAENFNATVSDITGRIIQRFLFDANQKQQLDYSQLKDGLYLLRINNEHTMHTFKIMINK